MDQFDDNPLAAGQLATIAKIAGALADHARPFGGELRQARGVLLALRAAILGGSLESLAATVLPWARAEVERMDALTQAAAHDEMSALVREMGVPDEDWVQAQESEAGE